MIANHLEYEKACQELQYLEAWLDRLRREHSGPDQGLTKAGIRKLLSHLHEELAVYEGSLEVEKTPAK